MDRPPKNLFHPLTLLEWRKCSGIPVSVYNAQAVLLGYNVYIGGGSIYSGLSSELLVYDFTKDLWKKLYTPTQWYALTTYHSQLVLVGGRDATTWKTTNQLWVLDEQCQWIQPLPAMTIKRYQASAVSVGDYLIVAGGCGGPCAGDLDGVEVYDGNKWRQIQSLPRKCSSMKSALLEGNWYLVGQHYEVYHTSLKGLIASSHSEEAGQTSVWKKLPDVPLKWSTPAKFLNQLITVGRGQSGSAIHAYSPSLNSWVHVGDLPVACYSTCTLLLPTEELLVVGEETQYKLSSLSFRVKVRVTSFPYDHFDMSALDRLEKVACISIFNDLVPKFLEFASALDFDEPTVDSLRENNPIERAISMFRTWLSGKSSLPPTWQVLLEKLQAIGMGELAQEIEKFLSGTLSLMSGSKLEFEAEWQTKPDHSDMAVQTHGETTAAETTGYLRGVDVIAETSIQVTNQSQTFPWAGYGLKLHIPQGALPTGLNECRLLIKMGLSGQFALPQNTSLVSAVYWLDSEPRLKFSQPLTLEIQHCVKPNHSSRLSFVHAKCSQTHLPYAFEAVEGGIFSSESAYGCTQCEHFSLMAIICNPFLLFNNTQVPEVQLYRASLYYIRKGANQIDIHFVITRDQEPHTTFVRRKYIAEGATIGPNLQVVFESNSISLELPSRELILNGGWKIVPLVPPEITKEDVDSFKTGQEISSCQLTAIWTTQNEPSQLIHKIPLKGTKKPSFFSIILDCDSIPTEVRSHQVTGRSSGELMEHSQVPTPDMKDLMDALYHTVADKWEHIGIYLRLPMPTLKAITSEHNHNPHKCLIGMLEVWLKTLHPTPTWSAIIEAVEFLGEKQLARKLKEKYYPLNL